MHRDNSKRVTGQPGQGIGTNSRREYPKTRCICMPLESKRARHRQFKFNRSPASRAGFAVSSWAPTTRAFSCLCPSPTCLYWIRVDLTACDLYSSILPFDLRDKYEGTCKGSPGSIFDERAPRSVRSKSQPAFCLSRCYNRPLYLWLRTTRL